MPRVLSSEDVEDFRRRLCVAAEALFAERGPEAVTMRELATAMGVSPMTPYRYFQDKDAILAAVRAAAFTRFAEALEAGMGQAGDPIVRSRQAGMAYIEFALAQPQAYRLMFDLNQPTEADYPDLQAAVGRARRTMTAHVEGMIRAGLLEGDAEMIGHMFWSVLHGMLMLQITGKLAPTIDPQALRRQMFATLLRGLGLPEP
ncbi:MULTISPECIES: TetR/AcrR family transcriptional regulator [unclassified Caulobacter]|uniref:TetR/AcrR family transcriptional regulator n=1 Tax=unclassified Caulobacter TaxID=2648921 RepID=UPI000D3C8BCA|nr:MULTISPECIES: TetR/AcrR family transcriptional regulator [unclassified Caulobacter]PTS89549.1 TetR/AcrR family transcriptional regulator [Caulobacter sp. HMWF009]PTT09385.1 TetR/AcrR family transcriptional regulator [Caulobacter sp. HMWF025]